MWPSFAGLTMLRLYGVFSASSRLVNDHDVRRATTLIGKSWRRVGNESSYLTKSAAEEIQSLFKSNDNSKQIHRAFWIYFACLISKNQSKNAWWSTIDSNNYLWIYYVDLNNHREHQGITYILLHYMSWIYSNSYTFEIQQALLLKVQIFYKITSAFKPL